MKIFISMDIEGVAGVCEPIQGQRGNPEYEVARRLMTEEANAAIGGAFDGGGTEVTVADSHGPMRNIIAEMLDSRARLVSGKPRPLSMIQGLTADYDGVLLIGYHAAAGQVGVLAHTTSGLAFAGIRMNGTVTGEPTLFGGYAAELGVPVLAVSGDDRLGAEIAVQFPLARRIQTKTALGAQTSESLSPEHSRALIRAEVRAAVGKAADFNAVAPCALPLNVEITMSKQVFADGACLLPHVTRIDATTIAFEAGNHAEAIATISALSLISKALAA